MLAATIGGALVALAALLVSMSLWRPDDRAVGRGPDAPAGLAAIMANVMAPATESVMSSVPDERAGVGSATNDVVRQVAGAFAVAILGSSLATVYGDRMSRCRGGPAPGLAAVARGLGGRRARRRRSDRWCGWCRARGRSSAAFMGGMDISLVIAASGGPDRLRGRAPLPAPLARLGYGHDTRRHPARGRPSMPAVVLAARPPTRPSWRRHSGR